MNRNEDIRSIASITERQRRERQVSLETPPTSDRPSTHPESESDIHQHPPDRSRTRRRRRRKSRATSFCSPESPPHPHPRPRPLGPSAPPPAQSAVRSCIRIASTSDARPASIGPTPPRSTRIRRLPTKHGSVDSSECPSRALPRPSGAPSYRARDVDTPPETQLNLRDRPFRVQLPLAPLSPPAFRLAPSLNPLSRHLESALFFALDPVEPLSDSDLTPPLLGLSASDSISPSPCLPTPTFKKRSPQRGGTPRPSKRRSERNGNNSPTRVVRLPRLPPSSRERPDS